MHMIFLNNEELEAVRSCVSIGRRHGFGNMIDRLRMAWALHLIEESGLSVKSACMGALMSVVKVKMYSKLSEEAFKKQAREYIGDTQPVSSEKNAT